MPKKGSTPAEDAIFEIWELGNIAHGWADSPASITPDDLDFYLQRCANAHVDGTRLLYRFQQYIREQELTGQFPTVKDVAGQTDMFKSIPADANGAARK